uniref:Uncharacterized protein n=1 Tax=Pyramimonas obovata TaxID=1411642 RepID=A0A7S0WUR4_9CHLO
METVIARTTGEGNGIVTQGTDRGVLVETGNTDVMTIVEGTGTTQGTTVVEGTGTTEEGMTGTTEAGMTVEERRNTEEGVVVALRHASEIVTGCRHPHPHRHLGADMTRAPVFTKAPMVLL